MGVALVGQAGVPAEGPGWWDEGGDRVRGQASGQGVPSDAAACGQERPRRWARQCDRALRTKSNLRRKLSPV